MDNSEYSHPSQEVKENITINQAPPVNVPPAYVQPPVPPYRAKKPKLFEADRYDYFAAVFALISGATGVSWGLFGGFRLGWSIAFAVLLVSGFIYLAQCKKSAGAFSYVCGILSALTAPVFFVTSNSSVKCVAFIVQILLAVILFAGMSGRKIPSGDFGLPVYVFKAVIGAFSGLESVFKSLLSTGKKVTKVILGILCAVPVLCIVLPLLVKSDAAFEGLVGNLFDSIGEAVAKLVVTFIVSPLLISFLISLRRGEEEKGVRKELKGLDTAFLTAFICALDVCYLVYLFSQLAYFFSAFSGFLPADYQFTYAEYARRGFFELCIIAAINLLVMFFVISFSRKKEEKVPLPLRLTSTFTGLFTLLLIATAVSKLVMYINNYGMTVMRMVACAFLAFTAVVFISMIARCYFAKVKVLHIALICGSVITCLTGLCNINSVIAKYNYEAYISGKLDHIDVNYISELEDEGIPCLIKLTKDSDTKVSAEAKKALTWKILENYQTEYTYDELSEEIYGDVEKVEVQGKIYDSFYELSLPKIRAYREIEKYFVEDISAMEKFILDQETSVN